MENAASFAGHGTVIARSAFPLVDVRLHEMLAQAMDAEAQREIASRGGQASHGGGRREEESEYER
jgi:hypothetical protein